VKSAKDPEFTAIVAGNAQAFQEAGTSRAVDAGGLDWSCFEGSQDGLVHTICVTPKYGRIVEVQHIMRGGSIGSPWTPSLGVSAKALRH
jgi:hypothetical protein